MYERSSAFRLEPHSGAHSCRYMRDRAFVSSKHWGHFNERYKHLMKRSKWKLGASSFEIEPIFTLGLSPKGRLVLHGAYWPAYARTGKSNKSFIIRYRTHHVSAHYVWERLFAPRHVPGLW